MGLALWLGDLGLIQEDFDSVGWLKTAFSPGCTGGKYEYGWKFVLRQVISACVGVRTN